MESDLNNAWGDQLYWIALKYDLDPEDDGIIRLFNEIYEEGWQTGFAYCVDLVEEGDLDE